MRDHQGAKGKRKEEKQERMGNKWTEESHWHSVFILENVLPQVPAGSILEL